MCFSDLKGNRIILSSIDKSGLDDMYEYSKNPLLYKYLEFEPQKSINETRDYLIKLISRSNVDNAHYWFIRLTENRKVIGTFGVHDIDWRKQSAEISYGISPDYWGKGHIFEATGLVSDGKKSVHHSGTCRLVSQHWIGGTYGMEDEKTGKSRYAHFVSTTVTSDYHPFRRFCRSSRSSGPDLT